MTDTVLDDIMDELYGPGGREQPAAPASAVPQEPAAAEEWTRETPEEFTDKTAEVPAAPAAQPAEPTAQPAEPAAQPAEPAAQPAAPAAQPAEPAVQPAAPAVQPAAPAAQPAMDERFYDELHQISEFTGKISTEVREMHKLYHNEYAGRLQKMQAEIERYREAERGRIFDDVLSEIAKIYSNNEAVIDRIEDEKVKKQVRYMFMDMLQVLESYGVEKQKSAVGEKRNTRFCQVIERLATADPSLHDTVARSRNTGFYIEKRPIVKEMVDVYLYSPEAAQEAAQEAAPETAPETVPEETAAAE